MSEVNCSPPLHRTYQVAMGIIVIPTLAAGFITSLIINQIGTGIAIPVDYIVNGNLDVTIGQYNQREKYIDVTLYKTGVWFIQ
jgi:hypothetical protein